MNKLSPNVDLVVDANGHFARVFYAISTSPSQLLDEDDLNDKVHDVMCGGLMDLLLGGTPECPIDPRPTRLALVWDGVNRRDKRRNKPDAYYVALKDVREHMHERFSCTNIIAPGEADDAIASLAVTSARQGNLVYVASSDKDLQQVISPQIHQYSWHMHGWVTPDYACQHWGLVSPQHVAFYLALCGDAVDKIPGVTGIGPKRFKQLYECVDKKMSFEAAFVALEAHLPEDKRDQFREMLDLTLLDTALVLPEPSPYRLH